MHPLKPIQVVDLFPELLEKLLVLLEGLSPAEWQLPTVCAPWTVHDVALHLLGGDIGILSRERDQFQQSHIAADNWDELVAAINRTNALWVEAARRISPRLLCDMLRFTGEQVCAHFAALDPHASGNPVSWAGAEPAPVWLDLAREYTERWHHQQHIRDAVDQPGAKEPRFFAPVLDAYVRAVPHTFRHVAAPDGSAVALTITGAAGGDWVLVRQADAWTLYAGRTAEPRSTVTMDQEAAWRLFTKGIDPAEAATHVELKGDYSLGRQILEAVAIIA